MDITQNDVKHIAMISRLEIADSEIAEYQNHLVKVLASMEELSQLDISNVEPLFSPVFDVIEKIAVTTRTDEVKQEWSAEDTIANAPRHKQNQFLVEAVIEDN